MNKSLIFIFLLCALAIRLFRVDAPLMEFHPVRQYIGASVARDFYFDNNSKIPEWRQEIAKFSKEHQELLEPQILPTLTAWGYQLTGGEHLWIPHLISSLCWLVGGFFLLRIATKLFSPGASLVALAFYLFMPYAIVGSRSFQPDSMMIMLMLAGLALVLGYDEQPTTRKLWAAITVMAVAMLVRPMALVFVFPPFLFLLAQKNGFFRSLFHRHTILFAVVPLLPTVAYYLYGMKKGGFIATHSEETFMPGLFMSPHYWMGWLDMIGRTAGWLPALIGLFAVLFVARGRAKMVLAGLWGGYLAYGLIFNYHIHTHDYYSLPLLPIVAVSLAVAVESPLAKLAALWTSQRRQLVTMTALCVIGLGAVAWGGKKLFARNLSPETKTRLKSAGGLVGFYKKFLLFLGREEKINRMLIADYEKIGELVGHTSRTIQLADDDGKALMYHGEFWGACWPTAGKIRRAHNINRKVRGETIDEFENMARLADADYFVVTLLKDFDLQEKLKRHISENYPVLAQGERFIIYRLKKKVVEQASPAGVAL